MKNSKKFSNVAKKSLAVALAVLSLTGSAQNVSAMKQAGTKLELNYLMNVMQNIHDKEMLKKFEQVSKKCGDTFEGTFMNPISVTKDNAEKFFPKLETQYLYSKNDEKIWGEKESKEGEEESKKGKSKYIDCYSFNPHSIDSATRNSTMNFVSGSENIDDLTENEQHICDIANYFIAMSKADFNVFEEKYGFETIKLDNFGNGVQCQIKKFKDRNETPKAFVCVVVPKNSTFTKENMDTIKQELSNQRLANSDGFLQFDFENVNLVIRPKTRTAKFEIGEHAIDGCDNSTINAQGATISGKKAIYGCDNSTINTQGAKISGKHAFDNCGKDSTINVNEEQVSDANNKVCKSENVKINDRSSEEIKSEVKQQQPKEQIKTEAERTKVSKSDAASVNNSSEYYILEKSKEKIAKTSKSENKFSKQAVIGGVVGFLSICTITAVAFKNKIKKFFNQHIVKKDKKLNQKLTRVK